MRRFQPRNHGKQGYTTDNILQNLQSAIDQGTFAPPMFTDEHLAFGKGRLTAFRSDVEWLITFEYLIFAGEAGRYVNRVYCYGNRIERRLVDKSLFELIVEPDSDPDPLDLVIRLDSATRHFQFTPNDYKTAGIDLAAPISGYSGFDKRVQILRLLVALLPTEELFLPASDLCATARHLPPLPIFLQVFKWSHPDPRLQSRNRVSSCLRTLARALADNVVEEYECPPELSNSDWSHWPRYGFHDR